MTPVKYRLEDYSFSIQGIVLTSAAEAAALVGLKGATPELAYVPYWNGHEFEVIQSVVEWYEDYNSVHVKMTHDVLAAYEYSMIAHFPVDPRTVALSLIHI